MAAQTEPTKEEMVKEKVATPAGAVPGSEDQAKAPRGPVIFLVEDDPLLVKMYTSKLTSEGFQVLTAQDGEQALEIAQKEKIDLIVLDIMMPKLSGLDFLAKLRQTPRGKDTPVIVLTNLTQKEETRKALDLGVKEYLVKADHTPRELIAKIREHLKK
jgi:DNA-binding response OmpR family regulator